MPEQSARAMLEKRLAELGSLFNAGVRAQTFREWRQATLTCIQRIWPSDPAKSERFRRIPFSAPMGRPGDREVREYYERGCGEALSMLKDYIIEIGASGVPSSAGGRAPSPGASGSDADFPTVDLPGSKAPVAPAPKPRLKDLLGFTDPTPDLTLVAPEPVPAPGPHPVPAATVAAAAPHGAPPLPQPPTPAPVAPAAPMGALPSAATPGAFGSGAPIGVPSLPGLEFFSPPASVREAASAGPPPGFAPHPGARLVREDPEHVTGELLRAKSPQSPRPAEPEQMVRESRSSIALAVMSLAHDVDSLGVPDGHRARARAVLLELSRRLDEPKLPWGTLRDAVSFAMEFPALGRRVVPLLLPYFDRAA